MVLVALFTIIRRWKERTRPPADEAETKCGVPMQWDIIQPALNRDIILTHDNTDEPGEHCAK